jgi:hypothetical protein
VECLLQAPDIWFLMCLHPQVRGVLNDEEVQMAVAGRYLRGVHALVATPDMALALLTLPNSPLSFQVWL